MIEPRRRHMELYPKGEGNVDLVLIHEEVRHALDPEKSYWLVTRRCFEALWEGASPSPGTENNVLYLSRELR